MNPVPYGDGLKLNVSKADNAKDLGLALSIASVFRVGPREAESILSKVKHVVRQWPRLATRLGISEKQQEQMTPAFALAAS